MTERYYAWRDAEVAANDDPEIDFSGNGPLYNPSDFIDEDVNEAEPVEEQMELEGEQTEVKTLPEVKPESRPNA